MFNLFCIDAVIVNIKKYIIFLAVIGVFIFRINLNAETYRADIVIYGGTSAGITAAVQAKRMGNSVIVVSPDRRLGGAKSNGVATIDDINQELVGGLAREFYHRVWRHYQSLDTWEWEKREDYGNRGQGSPAIDQDVRTMWHYEPGVASSIFESWVLENNLTVVRGEFLNRLDGVELEKGKILSISSLAGNRYEADLFIDCSYEGDLMAASGVSYYVGRESNARYGESLNGVQSRNATSNQFINRIDPFLNAGDLDGTPLMKINAGSIGMEGSADKCIPAYHYRLCLTKLDGNVVPFSKPEGYDPANYELLLRSLLRGSRHVLSPFKQIPNAKVEVHSQGPFSIDNVGMNYEYPDASFEQRRKIMKEHENYQRGYFYFLSNEPRVPEEVRSEISKWGLAKDEFVENDHWPLQMYIPEARRMIGDFVMTELEVTGKRQVVDPIAILSNPININHAQRYLAREEEGSAYVLNEGDLKVSIDEPFQISFRSIVPQREECLNLLVPVCLSASHVAFGSISHESVYMMLAQSAATAASLAVNMNKPVQDISYDLFRMKLLDNGQVLSLTRSKRVHLGEGISRAEFGGVVVDGDQIELRGPWTESSSLRPFVGASYFHDANAEKGMCSARFPFIAPEDGLHEIKVSFSVFGNRAGNIRYEINHGEGSENVFVDQRQPHLKGELWCSLGSFPFQKGEQYFVELFNENTKGYVVVDALQILAL
jgi:hypothetical protein